MDSWKHIEFDLGSDSSVKIGKDLSAEYIRDTKEQAI